MRRFVALYLLLRVRSPSPSQLQRLVGNTRTQGDAAAAQPADSPAWRAGRCVEAHRPRNRWRRGQRAFPTSASPSSPSSRHGYPPSTPTASRPGAARNPPLQRVSLTAAAGTRQVFRDFAPQKLAGTDFFSENMECPPDVESPKSCMARYLPPTPPHPPRYPPIRPAIPLLRCITIQLATRSVELLRIGQPNASKNGDACAVLRGCMWERETGDTRRPSVRRAFTSRTLNPIPLCGVRAGGLLGSIRAGATPHTLHPKPQTVNPYLLSHHPRPRKLARPPWRHH